MDMWYRPHRHVRVYCGRVPTALIEPDVGSGLGWRVLSQRRIAQAILGEVKLPDFTPFGRIACFEGEPPREENGCCVI